MKILEMSSLSQKIITVSPSGDYLIPIAVTDYWRIQIKSNTMEIFRIFGKVFFVFNHEVANSPSSCSRNAVQGFT